MRRLLALIAVAVFIGALAGIPAVTPVYAQDMSKPTKDERAAARAAKKAKRTACSQQADERNLHLVKRYRFVRSCMKTT